MGEESQAEIARNMGLLVLDDGWLMMIRNHKGNMLNAWWYFASAESFLARK